jgi:alanyl-tRNA synthetase
LTKKDDSTKNEIDMTEKIYQQDPYCRECTARVSASLGRDGRFQVRLERTIFCPEGGGQPADNGTINGIPLLALETDGDDIVHVLELNPGEGDVCLRLDFARRYDHMQQHTAQHLLSQILLRLLNTATLSFAIGAEHSSIEIGRQALDEEEIRALEKECARLIFAGLPVKVFASEDISSLQLRKAPKVKGSIRVVEINGFDQSACGGTHLKSSAEIGLLKIVRTERVRANVRLYYMAGYRALRDFQLKHETLQRIQRVITLPWAEIPAQIETLLAERDGQRRELKKSRRHEAEREIAALAAAPDPLVIREFSDADNSELRFFATALMGLGKHVLAYARSPQPYVAIGRGPGTFDLRQLSARIFTLLNGKGGGRENLLEGRGEDLSRIAEVAALLRENLTEKG